MLVHSFPPTCSPTVECLCVNRANKEDKSETSTEIQGLSIGAISICKHKRYHCYKNDYITAQSVSK